MQRDAVATDLQHFNARCPQPIHYGEDHYDEYMDRWEAMEKNKADILQFSQTLNYVLLHGMSPCHKARIRTTLYHAQTFENTK
eukprot:739564-Amphidinium_carterae.1